MTTSETVKEKPPGLMTSKPVASLALMAAGLGVIALASIGVEIWTGQTLAENADLGVAFISAPLGIATAILAGLTARHNPRWALPGLVLAVLYGVIFVLAA